MNSTNKAFEKIVRKPPDGRDVELFEGIFGFLAWMPEPGMRSMRCFLISDAFEPPLRSDALVGDNLPDDEHQILNVHMRAMEDQLLEKGRAKVSQL